MLVLEQKAPEGWERIFREETALFSDGLWQFETHVKQLLAFL